jgi:hypothetical protein
VKPLRIVSVRVLAPIMLAVLVSGCAKGFMVPLKEQPCGEWSSCAPEEALEAPLKVLRTNDATLMLSCGVVRERSSAIARACAERASLVAQRLSSLGVAVGSSQIEESSVRIGEGCLDTFIPGREARDCGFHTYSVTLNIPSWPQ